MKKTIIYTMMFLLAFVGTALANEGCYGKTPVNSITSDLTAPVVIISDVSNFNNEAGLTMYRKNPACKYIVPTMWELKNFKTYHNYKENSRGNTTILTDLGRGEGRRTEPKEYLLAGLKNDFAEYQYLRMIPCKDKQFNYQNETSPGVNETVSFTVCL